MATGLVLSLQQFTIPATSAEADVFFSNVAQVVGALAAGAVGIAVLVRFLPSMPYLNRIVNRESLAEASVGTEAEKKEPDRHRMVGRTGKTLTTLRPSGRAEIDGTLRDVVAEGAFIEKGREVQVVAVHGNRIVVAPREEVQA
jgi:membrane-bound serine protease (ClpP class)